MGKKIIDKRKVKVFSKGAVYEDVNSLWRFYVTYPINTSMPLKIVSSEYKNLRTVIAGLRWYLGKFNIPNCLTEIKYMPEGGEYGLRKMCFVFPDVRYKGKQRRGKSQSESMLGEMLPGPSG